MTHRDHLALRKWGVKGHPYLCYRFSGNIPREWILLHKFWWPLTPNFLTAKWSLWVMWTSLHGYFFCAIFSLFDLFQLKREHVIDQYYNLTTINLNPVPVISGNLEVTNINLMFLSVFRVYIVICYATNRHNIMSHTKVNLRKIS